MKVRALKSHKCYCCGSVIKRNEECFAFIVAPLDPEKNEFEIIYTCLDCLNDGSCMVKIKARGGIEG